MKPHLIQRRGYWRISNWTDLLMRTTANSKERKLLHLALDWVRRNNNDDRTRLPTTD